MQNLYFPLFKGNCREEKPSFWNFRLESQSGYLVSVGCPHAPGRFKCLLTPHPRPLKDFHENKLEILPKEFACLFTGKPSLFFLPSGRSPFFLWQVVIGNPVGHTKHLYMDLFSLHMDLIVYDDGTVSPVRGDTTYYDENFADLLKLRDSYSTLTRV